MMKTPMIAAAGMVLLTVACGGAAEAGPSADRTVPAPSASADLSRRELAKLDDSLRERVEADADTDLFPVRVKFVSRPSRDELTEMLLVAYERDAVGRVDRATLKAIAGRADVRMISWVDAGYGGDAEPEDDDFGAD
jgi:hypothetical protein